MKTSLRNLISFSKTIALAGLVALAASKPVAAPAQYFRTVLVDENPVGPDGTPRAHVGDTITDTVRVINEDDFGDTVTVNSVTNVVHHGAGDAVSGNLLAGPEKLDPYLLVEAHDTLDVTTSYVVQPDDGDLLSVSVDVFGTLNFDGPGGSGLPEGFEVLTGGQIRILRPSIKIGLEVAAGGGYNASLRNTGNTLLVGVVVSNVVNGLSTYVLGPVSIAPGEVLAFNLPADAGTSASAGASNGFRLAVWGTDELGLTVSDSVSTRPVLQAAVQAGSNIRLRWNAIRSGTYQVQYTTDLAQGHWTNLGSSLIATSDSATTSDTSWPDAHRFYRVALLP